MPETSPSTSLQGSLVLVFGFLLFKSNLLSIFDGGSVEGWQWRRAIFEHFLAVKGCARNTR